jgi:hypothetical protein
MTLALLTIPLLRSLRTAFAIAKDSGSNARQVSVIEKELPNGNSFSMAGPTGFEPAIFSVTGRRIRPAIPRAH